jgi:hypothetical protein
MDPCRDMKFILSSGILEKKKPVKDMRVKNSKNFSWMSNMT